MSQDRMKKAQAELAAEVQEILRRAEAAGRAEVEEILRRAEVVDHAEAPDDRTTQPREGEDRDRQGGRVPTVTGASGPPRRNPQG